MPQEKQHPDSSGINDVIGFAKERGCVMLDIRFMDLPGLWQHYTFPIAKLKQETIEEGLPMPRHAIDSAQ